MRDVEPRMLAEPTRPVAMAAAPTIRRDAAAARPVPPAPTVVLADAPAPIPPMQPIELNRLAGRWDDVVEAVRASGRGLVASSLAEAIPANVSNGVVTIQVASEALGAAIERASDTVLGALRVSFSGVQQIVIVRAEGSQATQKRMTEGDVIAHRVATLRKGAPLLDAAFDTLDLRLIE